MAAVGVDGVDTGLWVPLPGRPGRGTRAQLVCRAS